METPLVKKYLKIIGKVLGFSILATACFIGALELSKKEVDREMLLYEHRKDN